MMKRIIASVVLLTAGCAPAADLSVPQAVVPPAVTATPQPTSASPPATATTPPTAVSTPTPPPPPTATPDTPFYGWRLEDLAARGYGGSGIVIGEEIAAEAAFTRYSMRYPSDGLTITGLINIPTGGGSFPTIIVNHGYGPPEEYYPGYDSSSVANSLARAGYIALMPDYRNYGGSDEGPNPFRIGYAIDVMNLVAQVDSLPDAAPGQIGIIGHSMGGGISHWPMLLQPEVDAVVLYAAMHGDIAINWRHIRALWNQQSMDELAATYGTPDDNPDEYLAASAVDYSMVSMPVMLHHGTLDSQVPYQWSVDRAQQMEEAGVEVFFYTYEGEGHSFFGETYNTFMRRNILFFDQYVRQ